ncbi:hypothetical protein FF011L_22060 [Roseimaritima multifibrata]|uniref:Uncharacterized protein n=1 Tax=Roseimaritima multifibrata TaxID=1930274 RepID=A0A517MF11_9BACT|nr:hypothetical protein [Roseimaritima multifibrata]QDS93436.1 hypothetical protein FF011L_22060 [Roseimaritima multifibrata]
MRISLKFLLAGMVLFAVGCKENASTETAGSDEAIVMEGGPPEALDAHPTEGPHHGSLVELGNEEYHAEVTHDDTSVTVYILDGHAEKQVPVATKEITINLVHDGKPEQFVLVSAPDVGETEELSSRFTIVDPHLVADLDAEGSNAKLSLTIKGTPYRGEIKHDHESHEGHDHAH